MKLGNLDIKKVYLGDLELTSDNAFVGRVSLVESAPWPDNRKIQYKSSSQLDSSRFNSSSCGANLINNIYNSTTGVGELQFDSDVTKIMRDCFMLNSSLISVSLPNSVTIISDNAFMGCSNLISITIPNSVTTIGDSAFSDCVSMTSVTIPESVTSLGRNVFGMCSGLTEIVVDSRNTIYDSRNNCNAIIKTSTNELVRGCQTTVIPNSIAIIGAGSFSRCSALINIVIPDSVVNIGSGAFRFCSSLTSITIPKNVTQIGSYAFSDCDLLTAVVWNAKNCTIGGFVFNSENTNELIDSFSFGNEVEVIPRSLCNRMLKLTSVTIPNSVINIGNYAFYASVNLSSIIYEGTMSDWSNVTLGTEWANETATTVVHCTDGDVAI